MNAEFLLHYREDAGGWQIIFFNGSQALSFDEQMMVIVNLDSKNYYKLFNESFGFWKRLGNNHQFFIFHYQKQAQQIVDKLNSLLIMKELVGEQ